MPVIQAPSPSSPRRRAYVGTAANAGNFDHAHGQLKSYPKRMDDARGHPRPPPPSRPTSPPVIWNDQTKTPARRVSYPPMKTPRASHIAKPHPFAQSDPNLRRFGSPPVPFPVPAARNPTPPSQVQAFPGQLNYYDTQPRVDQMPVPHLYPGVKPEYISRCSQVPRHTTTKDGALGLRMSNSPSRPHSNASRRTSPSPVSSRSASDIESTTIQEVQKSITRAELEAYNCREMISTWYKKAYGKWTKGKSMTSLERVLFEHVWQLYKHTRTLCSQVHKLRTIFEYFATCDGSLPYQRPRNARHYTSVNANTDRASHHKFMTRSSCERIVMHCEDVDLTAKTIQSGLDQLQATLATSSTSPVPTQRGFFEKIGYYMFEFHTIIAEQHAARHRLAIRGLDGHRGSEMRTDGNGTGHLPTSILTLNSEVQRGKRVVNFALKGLEGAMAHCLQILMKCSSVSSTSSSRNGHL